MNRTVAQIARHYIHGDRDPRGDAQPRRGGHPRLRPLPELLDPRARADAAARPAARPRRRRCSTSCARMTDARRTARRRLRQPAARRRRRRLARRRLPSPPTPASPAPTSSPATSSPPSSPRTSRTPASPCSSTQAWATPPGASPSGRSRPSPGPSWSHHLRPEDVVRLAQALFGATPQVFLVTVTGAHFGYGTQLSPSVSSCVPKVLAIVDSGAPVLGPQVALSSP